MTTRTPTDDVDPVLKDGETLVVPMAMMTDTARMPAITPPARQISDDDAVLFRLHKPGYAQLSDAQVSAKQAVYDSYDKRMVDAFKEAPPLVNGAKPATASAKVTDSREAAYVAYSKRLADAWRAA